MSSTPRTQPPVAAPSADALRRLVGTELSMASRLGYVALLLAASMMTTVISALWITEQVLPPRTHIAFALMIAIGLSWIVFAVWALRNRRPLFADHAIVAGRLAVTFTSLFLMGALIASFNSGGRAPYAAAVVGLAMLGTAIVLLRRAHRTSARLMERRDTLKRERERSAQ